MKTVVEYEKSTNHIAQNLRNFNSMRITIQN
jgi:hypothetical protein